MSKTSEEVFDATQEGTEPELKRDPNRKVFFTSRGQLPVVAALLCALLAGPWVGRHVIQYQIAGGLMAIGVVLWFVTWLINRKTNKDQPENESRGKA